ncbi:MAG TPA: exosortase/archaeosortase family protein, partial [Pseudoxanthomonas sp.]|nr:exosortase/archaeosortase family protein [Pseudoxanthomonas sp.]
AFLTDTTLAKRWTLFLFSLPLSLAINVLRITLIGVVGECIGASAAVTFHDWSGLITLIVCMAALFGFAKALGCRTFAGQPLF